MIKKNRVVLIVLDGVGLGKNYFGNAFSNAKTPFIDSLFKKYPNTKLGASEKYVGLKKGQIGSSEIGHSTIGAGRVNDSDLVRIDKLIKSKKFHKNKKLNSSLNKIKKDNSLHLVGLLSDGGVHSHINHLIELLRVIKTKKNIPRIYLHLFTDGRDTDPRSSLTYISKIKHYLEKFNLYEKTHLASISGRFYGMDRDNRWDRQKKVYDLLVYKKGNISDSPAHFIKTSYKKSITDEFLEPTLFREDGIIKEKDTVLFFNFRSDRAREFTRMFTSKNFKNFKTKKLNLNFITFTQYDKDLNINVLFPENKPKPGLAKIFDSKKIKQLRIAETEKYAHVTYFFNQGQDPYKTEKRILIPSPKVETYDLKPEMSAEKITNAYLKNFTKDFGFCLINFANGDMVGHSGNLSKTIEGLEKLDSLVEKICKKTNLENTDILITADHGNCDHMINKDGSINTAHSLNKVPFILVTNKKLKLKQLNNLSIANIAPTVLELMNIKKPNHIIDSLIKK